MSLLLQRNCSIHHASTYCRIVACMYVFLVWFLPWSVTFAFSEAALEETKLISEQQPSALGSSRHLTRTRPEGMSYIYYIDSCPRAYDLVREHMQLYISQDPSNAAGSLHMFFYDCFIQGCDASVLLEWPEVISERPDINSLRKTSFQIINEIKASLEVACPGVVSCADILALAARDAIFMVGGPWIPILTGRKDSVRMVTYQVVSASIPPPTFGFHELKHMFSSIGLSVKDLVALSGAHTIGQAHCGSVVSQLLPTFSGDLNPSFATNLSKICLTHDSLVPKPHLTLHLDGLTPNTFDNAFFKNVLRKEAIFQSDAVLMDDDEALSYVQTFALDQVQFFEQFRLSFVKMSQIGVLTDAEGEVRMRCTIRN